MLKELINLFSFPFRYDIMLHCWNEDPLERPNFTALREHLDEIMSQSADYLSFDIDQENTYYNVASFTSVPSDDEDILEIFEHDENAPKIMSPDELRAEKKLKKNAPKTNNVDEKKVNKTLDDGLLDKKVIGLSTPPSIIRQLNGIDEERYVQPHSLQSSMKKKIPQTSSNAAYVNTNFTNAITDLTM